MRTVNASHPFAEVEKNNFCEKDGALRPDRLVCLPAAARAVASRRGTSIKSWGLLQTNFYGPMVMFRSTSQKLPEVPQALTRRMCDPLLALAEVSIDVAPLKMLSA